MTGGPEDPLAPAPLEDPANGRWAARTFAALRVPTYRGFFVGQGLSMVGSWARSAAQGWLVYDLTGRELDLGITSALSFLPMALLSAAAGAVVDRVDRRVLLLRLQLVNLALSSLLAYAVVTRVVTPGLVQLVAVAMGTAQAFEMPCRQAFVADAVPREHLRNAVALNSAMINLALVLGPSIAGLLIATIGIAACFVFDAASFLAIIVVLLRVRLPVRAARPAAGPLRELLLGGVRYVRRDPVTRSLLVLLAIAMVCGWGYTSLLPAFSRRALGADGAAYGLLHASSGVGALGAALWVAGRDERHPGRTAFGCLFLFWSALGAMALVRTLLVAMLLRATAGFAMIAFFSTSNTTVHLRVPDDLRGRVIGLRALVFGWTLPLGQYLMGVVAEHWDTPTAFLGGAGAGCAACVLLAATRPFRDRPPGAGTP